MVDRLYLAYTIADAEWLIAHPELLKEGRVIYSGIEPHLVFCSAGIPADDAVELYRQLDFCTIANEAEYLRCKFEQTLRQVGPDYGLSLIYQDIDILSCSLHLLYYFFYEAVTSYHLAVAILQKYQPKEIWVNQSPFTAVTQWGLAPPPQTNYENQVWGSMRNIGVIIKDLEIPNTLESSNVQEQQIDLIYRSQYQPWQPQDRQRSAVFPTKNSLKSDVLLALQNNFLKNYAPIGEALANSFNLKTLDLIQQNLWLGWHDASDSIPVPLIQDLNNVSSIQINHILNDRRFSHAFLDYPLDIWKIIQSRVDLLLSFDIPFVGAWIECSHWVLAQVQPKFIVMAEEVSLAARSLGAVAKLHGIKKLVIEHGSPDTQISKNERSDMHYWQHNYAETRPDYVATWGSYGQHYYVENLGWSAKQVIPTGWPWIEREIRQYLGSGKTKQVAHVQRHLLFLSTSTHKSYHYLYETLLEAAKQLHVEIVIRPHGAENMDYLRDLANLVGINVKIDNSSNILDQIAESDIVIGGATSVLSYAIALSKPCIFLDLLGMRDYKPYAIEGAAIGVYNREELIPAIEKLNSDDEERNRQHKKQKLFTQQYLGELDGKATERIINFIKMEIQMQDKLSTKYQNYRTQTDILRVDIGCGIHKPKDFIGVDIAPGVGVDIVADLSKEFPFPDSSVDELRAHDIIEHLYDRIHTMNEIWRVCKPGAKVDIRVPSTDGRGAFQDPTHISFWNINSFLYYCSEFPAYIELCKRYGFQGEFKAVKLEHEESPDGVIHVRAELLVVKSVSNLSQNYLPITQEYQQEIQKQFAPEVNVYIQSQEQDVFSQISTYVKQYQQDPSRTAIANIRQTRYQIAQQWLKISDSEIESVYLGDLGKAHQILLNSGIKNEVFTPSEQVFVDEVTTHISRGLNKPKAVQYILVAMLYRCADQLPLQHDISNIPTWFINDYLKFLFQPQLYFQEVGEAENYYHYMQGWVDYLHTSIFQNQDSLLWHEVVKSFVQMGNFIPLYFNEANLKDIYVKRGEILDFFLKINGHQVNYEFDDRPVTRKKIRMGILAAYFLPSAETFATLPLYEYISRYFEVILYSLNQTGHPLEEYCQSCANSFKLLPQDLAEQANTIRADDLDILFIATNVTAVTNQICLLSMHRLARIQVTSGGSVVTTGMRYIDYYISGTHTDPSATSEQQYREKLVKLEGTAHCFSYGNEQENVTIKVDRESLYISEESVIFISGANFFKIIPELINTWAKIISGVPNSVLVLLPFGPNWSNNYPKKAFVNHLMKVFSKHGIPADQLIVLDPQPVPNREEVKEYFKIADVYLDSYPFAGTTSLVEPLQVNLPVIARQGNTFRSAMGSAMVQALDVSDLVADSEESYIQLAIALGINPQLRQQKSAQIKEKMQGNPSFLDSRSYSAKIGSLFQELFSKYLADTLSQNFRLGDINLVIFPDWLQPEDLLYQDLASVICTLTTHPDKSRLTLLIDSQNIPEEEADMLLSSLTMNLLMEDDVDITEGPEISLLGKISDTQWKTILPRINTRIALAIDNQQAIAHAKAENLPSCDVDSLIAK
ncbi:methyltransferase domain-containing protein [Nostoc sp. NMS2]|uniref:O-linked N-acetylglucosamine transferase family protein n=1 Tax=Nostoc sp. NMS2 TaxID=2815389 RepID=UPI0025EB5F82|nr:methyltransferase domain-containing protein [Nostoc sp. NMS2]